jgi:ABC-type dipeptide/oligopeptide/nickel transport systems, permease components
MRVLPGDPIRSQLGPRVSEEQANRIRERLGLNEPIMVQYVTYLKDIVTFNFGNALTQGERPIRDELGERLPATLELSIPAMIFTSVFGVGLGAYASKYRKKPVDYGIRLFSIIIYSIPIFFLGLIFQIVFGVRLGWLPLSGRMDSMLRSNFQSITNFYVLDSIITGNWRALWSSIFAF